ncbi:MAG TPA: hypothetical protein VG253_19635 [Streptosporangiaceae bacterium]|nr:hypothetical protein [Streptosporangiaceae bacterium]
MVADIVTVIDSFGARSVRPNLQQRSQVTASSISTTSSNPEWPTRHVLPEPAARFGQRMSSQDLVVRVDAFSAGGSPVP